MANSNLAIQDVEGLALDRALALEVHPVRRGVVGESAGVCDQVGDGFPFLGLVEHRTLGVAVDRHEEVVGGDGNDVAVLQLEVFRVGAFEDEVVQVETAGELAFAVQPDVTHGGRLRHAAGHEQGRADLGEGRECVGAGHDHVAHYVDGDGAGAVEADPDVGAASDVAVDLGQFRLQGALRPLDGHPAEGDGTDPVDEDRAVASDHAADLGRGVAPNIDGDVIAGAQDIAGGSRCIDARDDAERLGREEVVSVDLVGVVLLFLLVFLRLLDKEGTVLCHGGLQFCIGLRPGRALGGIVDQSLDLAFTVAVGLGHRLRSLHLAEGLGGCEQGEQQDAQDKDQ